MKHRSIQHRNNGIAFALALMLTFILNDYIQAQAIEAYRIYADSNHNAFTSLVKFDDNYYCAFRSGERHVYGRDGIIKIIRSRDARNWSDHQIITLPGYDLRDPKLSITPDGRLMLLCGGSVYQGQELLRQRTHVSFSDNEGNHFGRPTPIVLPDDLGSDFDWLWRVTWHGEEAFGVLYQRGQESTKLAKSVDGINYQMVCDLKLTGRPNEATIRFLGDQRMAILHRREEADQMGLWAVSSPPYTEWNWKSVNYRLGGPDFCVLSNEQILAGTRLYDEDGHKVALLLGNANGIFTLIHRFPSGGDCSYPGFVQEEDRILMSYYSSHEGKASIYLAEIPKSILK